MNCSLRQSISIFEFHPEPVDVGNVKQLTQLATQADSDILKCINFLSPTFPPSLLPYDTHSTVSPRR